MEFSLKQMFTSLIHVFLKVGGKLWLYKVILETVLKGEVERDFLHTERNIYIRTTLWQILKKLL